MLDGRQTSDMLRLTITFARPLIQFAKTMLTARECNHGGPPFHSFRVIQPSCGCVSRSQRVYLPNKQRAAGLPARRFNLLPGSQDVRNDGVRTGERPRGIIRGEDNGNVDVLHSDGNYLHFTYSRRRQAGFLCRHAFLFNFAYLPGVICLVPTPCSDFEQQFATAY